jgi:hypothetical protein
VERIELKQILVHDDVFANRFVSKIREIREVRQQFQIVPLYKEDFRKQMGVLIQRQRDARRKAKVDQEYDADSEFDRTAIFVVDYDLLRSDPDVEWNSETAAYLVRCFSQCGLIVGMNSPACNEFDLTLSEDVDSYADTNVVSKQLGNPGLWTEKRQAFRPWYWPHLIKELESFDKQTRIVRENLEESILQTIGLDSVAGSLSESITEFIGNQKRIGKTTFADFMHSPNALHRKDKNANLETLCRVSASRISKWFHQKVLPGQNTLVDAPHLVSRFPSLLVGQASAISSWNKTTTFEDHRTLGIKHSKIEPFRFKTNVWFSRPLWFWRMIAEAENIEEIKTPWEKKKSRFKFCEDASRFYTEEECDQFTAAVDSPYNRRWIRHFKDVDYQPSVRLITR